MNAGGPQVQTWARIGLNQSRQTTATRSLNQTTYRGEVQQQSVTSRPLVAGHGSAEDAAVLFDGRARS